MKREPCWTLSDLARQEGIKSSATFNHWAKKIPLPDEVKLPIDVRGSSKKYYKRSELMSWFNKAKPLM